MKSSKNMFKRADTRKKTSVTTPASLCVPWFEVLAVSYLYSNKLALKETATIEFWPLEGNGMVLKSKDRYQPKQEWF